MNLTILETAKDIYENYIRSVNFDQIEHVPDQFMPNQIGVQSNCICLTHQFFEKYYPSLIQTLTKTNTEQNHWIAEMILIMNGENDKAWNLKKQLLILNKLDLQRQLKFNAAVCYKNKKSSSYYDYRLKVFRKLIKNSDIDKLKELFQRQLKLTAQILGRFHRNYYCWLYRNKLLKLMIQTCGQTIIQIELKQLHKFIQSNPNDYSAYSRLIAIVQKYNRKIEDQLLWLKQLKQFCQLAYENKSSYTHICTYEKFLIKLQKELSKS